VNLIEIPLPSSILSPNRSTPHLSTRGPRPPTSTRAIADMVFSASQCPCGSLSTLSARIFDRTSSASTYIRLPPATGPAMAPTRYAPAKPSGTIQRTRRCAWVSVLVFHQTLSTTHQLLSVSLKEGQMRRKQAVQPVYPPRRRYRVHVRAERAEKR
jgi:hypothetical protein